MSRIDPEALKALLASGDPDITPVELLAAADRIDDESGNLSRFLAPRLLKRAAATIARRDLALDDLREIISAGLTQMVNDELARGAPPPPA